MTRRCHYVKGNKNCESIHDAIWVDTETKGVPINDNEERHELFMGMAAYRRTRSVDSWTHPRWTQFESSNEFWNWVEDCLHGKTRLYLFAHNWAFDAPVLDMFNILPERGWTLISAVIQSPPIILRWRKPPYTIQVVDTLNIWRMPLAKIGESIKLPKLPMPKPDDPRETWETYNRRDVEIIMGATIKWLNFLKVNDLGGFACTLAAQSMRTYRHRFMSKQILIDDNERALQLARDALHGGRTECHFIGTCPETIHKLDINSQYPAIMATEYLPARIIGHYTNVTYNECKDWVDEYCLTAKVSIDTDEPVYGIVSDAKLVFPIGTFTTVLSTPELAYAFEHDHITKVHEVAVYEREILFSEFVNYFTELRGKYRDAGNDAEAYNSKIMMNSLYGKWAQKGLHYTKVGDAEDRSIKLWINYDVEDDKVTHMRQYAGIIEEQGTTTESRDSHPAIAAHITAHGRIQIWGMMQRAGLDNVYYCDTDSVWCNEKGAVNLTDMMHPTLLGRLKVEGIHTEVIIHGPKDYMLDGKARIKGIKKKASCIGPGLYEQDKFTTLIGLLRRGDLTAPVVSRLTKQLRREYTKGIVNTDGRISPLSLSL